MAEESSEKITKKMAPDPQRQRAKLSALELVRLRNNFYRDNYRRMVSTSMLLVTLLIVLVLTCFWLITHRPPPRYFATNAQGGLVEIKPLSEAVLSNVEVNNWAARAAAAAFTLNYVQYRQQIEQTVDTYFTDQGGQQYQTALQTSNDLDYVQTGKLLVTAEPSAAPRILAQGIVPKGPYQGRYAWQVQVPLTVTTQNETDTRLSQLLVELVIVRSSTAVDQTLTNIDATLGIGIAQIIASGAAAPAPATTSPATTTTPATTATQGT